jgi:hypothetical protein
MKKTVLLTAILLALGGCANVEYQQYLATQSKMDSAAQASRSAEAVARYNADAAKYKAMSDIAATGSESSKVAAVMAIALGNQSANNAPVQQQTPVLQAPPTNQALQWASILVPSLTNVVGMKYNYMTAQTQSNNAAAVAISTNSTFASMGTSLQNTASSGYNALNNSTTALGNNMQSIARDGNASLTTVANNGNSALTTVANNGNSALTTVANNGNSALTTIANNGNTALTTIANNSNTALTTLATGNNTALSNIVASNNASMLSVARLIQAPAANVTTTTTTTSTNTIGGAGVVGNGTLATTDNHSSTSSTDNHSTADNHTVTPPVIVPGATTEKVCSVNAAGTVSCI